jgi:hypothetical protein
MYDDIAKSIPIKVKRSNYQSRWSDEATKQADFNEQYPEVSTGDLYVNRYRNQLVTYTPYSYLNSKTTATADIPLLYNTCEKMNLTYGKLSSGVIREYEDHINFYLNNYRSDTTNAVVDKIVIYGVKATPSYTMTMPTTGANSQKATITFKRYDSAKKTYTVWVSHLGPVLLSIKCTGEGTDRMTDVLPADTLALPKQPEPFKGPIIIEAENMDYKNVNVALTHSGWWAQEYKDFAAMGYVETYENANSSLRHSLKLTEGGDYNIRVRYCNSNKAGSMKATVNGTDYAMNFEKVDINDWREAVITTTLNAGENTLILQNSDLIKMTIDQIIYEPVGTPQEKFNVKVRDADFGHVVADVDSAVAGQTVHLTITPEDGYGIKALKVVSSIFFTQGKTIPV